MSWSRLPAVVAALTVSVYWGAVVLKLIRLGKRLGKDPNMLPREPVGLLMRVVWIPVIFLLVLHAWRIAVHFQWGFSFLRPYIVLPWENWEGEAPGWWYPLAWLGVAGAAGTTVATFVCWRQMGKSWRIGIDPKEKLGLVSTGPYRWVRHPIYALRMVLDVCVVAAVPTAFMAVMCGLDILLLQIEARREERYMEATHGEAYAAYKKRVGRFVPRGWGG